MTDREKIISEANKYVMPAVDDYLGARCLLLNNIFVGLTLAHEAVEKLIKALLILEKIKIPKSCHGISTLAKLLIFFKISKAVISDSPFIKISIFLNLFNTIFGYAGLIWESSRITTIFEFNLFAKSATLLS